MGLGQSPGLQLDPHFISQKPDEARDKFTHKPVGFFESLIRLVYKKFYEFSYNIVMT